MTEPGRPSKPRSSNRTLFWGGLLILGVALPWMAARAPELIDRGYSLGFFRLVASVLGALGSVTRISLAQTFLGIVAVVGSVLLARSILHWVRNRSLRTAIHSLPRCIAPVALLIWVFYLSWGLNYSRPLLRDRLGLEPVSPTPERLTLLVRVLAQETNQTYARAVELGEIEAAWREPVKIEAQGDRNQSENQVESPTPDKPEETTPHSSRLRIEREELLLGIAEAYRSITPSLAGIRFSTPKFPEPTGYLLTKFGISGFYFPFTGEATVNARLLDPSISFTAAHEMAHQRGIAREDEANMLAYLACRRSGFWATRYSGALAAYARARRALWRAAPDSLHALGSEILDDGPLTDRVAIHRFWRKHEGRAAGVATRINDSYLKANRQSEGVRTYDQMVEILLAFQEAGMLEEPPR